VYNLSKKKVAQMNEELSARRATVAAENGEAAVEAKEAVVENDAETIAEDIVNAQDLDKE
jgi:hypothetical protein